MKCERQHVNDYFKSCVNGLSGICIFKVQLGMAAVKYFNFDTYCNTSGSFKVPLSAYMNLYLNNDTEIVCTIVTKLWSIKAKKFVCTFFNPM